MCAAHPGESNADRKPTRRELAIESARAQAARLLAKAEELEAGLTEQAEGASEPPVNEAPRPEAKKPKRAQPSAEASTSASKPSTDKPPTRQSGDAKPVADTVATAVATAAVASAPAKRPPRKAAEKSPPVPARKRDARQEVDVEAGDPEEPSLWHEVGRNWSSWTVSAAVHAVLLVVLGLSFVVWSEEDLKNPLTAFLEGDEAEQLEDLMLEDLDVTVEAMQALPVNVTDPGEAALGEILGIEADVLDVAGSLAADDAVGDMGTPWGTDGKGYASSGSGLGGAEFYGVKAAGHRFVFIVDNSLSMKQGRFEAACIELYKSVCRMKSQQQFYVFFFSDTAYPLFYPQSVAEMVPATTRNQYKLEAWLRTIELVLKTNAQGAVQKALAMKPDAIYILTDGAFTDKTFQYLMKLEPGRTSIHTVGMELKPEHGGHLQQIAKRHHGTYRQVQVDPRLRMMVGKKSRRTHGEPGPVWGIALGKLGKPGANRGAGNRGGGKKGGKGQGKKKAKP